MTEPDRPRRWHLKKRWRVALAAVLLGLPLLLPFAAAHALYLAGRGDIPEEPVRRATLLGAWSPHRGGPAGWYQGYIGFSYQAGIHESELTEVIRRLGAETVGAVPGNLAKQRNAYLIATYERERAMWRDEAPLLFRQ